VTSFGSAQDRSRGSAQDRSAIELVNVTKIYRRFKRRQFATLKSALLQRSLLSDFKPDESFPALTDFSLAIRQGSSTALIGRNGSGKSTALKLVAGITKPTSGTVSVRGRISALIELGAGFHPEISGRENVFINGMMLGLTKREIEKRFDEIVEFAELADFIDEPVKTYSSGMYMRLGFSVAINVDPDVLLVDEVLAVGDEGFTHKCLDKFADFKRRGKTVLLVTHSLGLVERFCDEAVWVDAGRKKAEGDPNRVVDLYVADVSKQEEKFLAESEVKAQQAAGEPAPSAAPPVAATAEAATPSPAPQVEEGRWGSGLVEISNVALVDAQGQPAHIFQSSDPLSVRMTVRSRSAVNDFVFGIGIFTAEGVCVYGTNTDIEHFESTSINGEAEVTVAFESLELTEGTYKVDVAVHARDGAPYDYHRLLHTFRVKSRTKDVGLYRPRHKWAFKGAVSIAPKA
jgi:ABC-type polysaccharide/polyol phosphate transport system ATPase subunit